MSDEGFKEKPWHWWLSRVGIPLLVAVIGIGGVVHINRDRGVETSTSADSPSAPLKSGWGPAREMYTMREPSPTAVFNSIADNTAWGDERNLTRCRLSDDDHMTFRDDVPIGQGKTEIAVIVLIDNSSVKQDQKIRGAYMHMGFRSSGTTATIDVNLWADNAIKVWDGCRILGTSPVRLIYVPGSATFAAYGIDPFPVRDAVIRGEAPLPGIRGSADGEIGGDTESYGFVELRVEAFS